MKNRLQFRYHIPQILPTRNEALTYLKESFAIGASNVNGNCSLPAEPLVILYNDKTGLTQSQAIATANVMLAIGRGGDGITRYNNQDYFVIDFAKHDEDILALSETAEGITKYVDEVKALIAQLQEDAKKENSNIDELIAVIGERGDNPEKNTVYGYVEGAYDAVKAENERASLAEQDLSHAIQNETTRATAEETRLQCAIEFEETRAKASELTLNSALTTERDRALAAEEANRDAIENEIARATTNETRIESRLYEEENRAKNKEDILSSEIHREYERAFKAEGDLNKRIDDEITRATTKETELLNQISIETNRAKLVEDSTLTKLNEEIARAKAQETIIANALANEIARSTEKDGKLEAADAAINKRIDDEVSRAISKEDNLQVLITNEKDARIAADTALQTKIAENANAVTIEALERKNADTALANKIDNDLNTEIAARENADAVLESKFVTELDAERKTRENATKELNSKIDANLKTIDSNRVKSEGKTIVVTGPTDEGTNLEVNVDNKTIVINETGSLSVASDALVQYAGENAIHVSEVLGSAKTISLDINDNDKILTNDADGLMATLSLKWVHAEANGLKDEIQLIGKNDAVISRIDVADFIKDGMLDSIKFDTSDPSNPKFLFTFNTAAGKETIAVSVKELVDVYVGGNGVSVDNNVVSLKLDTTGEHFLSVTSEGLKLSGVQNAINTVKNDVNTIINSEISKVSTNIATLESKLVDETNARLSADAKIREDYVLADANIVKGYQDADVLLETAYKAEDAAIREAYKAADAEIITAYQSAIALIDSEYKAADANIITDYKNADTAIITGYQTEDAAIREAFATADAAITTDYKNADQLVREAFTAADAEIKAEYMSADEAIKSDYKAADEAIKSDYKAADEAIKSELNAEVTKVATDYKSADAKIVADYKEADANIISEFKAADAKITSDYKAADEAIKSELNATIESVRTNYTVADEAIKGLINVLDQNVKNETIARETADATINENIAAILPAAKTYTDNVVAVEKARAELVEQELLTKITNDVAAEATARENADASLLNKINEVVALESSTRENADIALGTRITNEIAAEKNARESAISTLDTKVETVVESERKARENADNELSAKINANVVTINANKVKSTGKTIVVTGPTDEGTNLEVNVDNKTIVINETGTLSVASDALVQYAGENAIHVSESLGGVKTVSLSINENDKILTNDENGLLASLSLKWVHAEVEGEKDEIQLLGKNDEIISRIDVADFIKDGMLDNIEFDTSDATNPKLVFTFNTSAGKETIYINVKELVDVYVAGNGITVDNNVISLKLDSTGEAFLSVTSEGLKLTGVQNAIETAKAEVNTTITNEVATLNTLIETLDGKLVTETNARLESDAKLREDYALADANIIKNYQDADALIETGYKAEDAAIREAYKAADAEIITAYQSAIALIDSEYKAADVAIREAFVTADEAIKADYKASIALVDSEYKSADAAIREAFATADEAIKADYKSADASIIAEFKAEDAKITAEFRAENIAIREAFTAADALISADYKAADEAIKADYKNADEVIREAFTSADAAIVADYKAADASIISEYKSADALIETGYKAEDAAIREAFATADEAIKADYKALIEVARNEFNAGDDAVKALVANVEQLIKTETVARETADATINENIAKVFTDAKIYADNAIAVEKARAELVEQELLTKINNDIAAEATARENADASLLNKINNDVTTESTLRETADTALATRITTEVESECKARENADNELSAKIDANVATINANKVKSTGKTIIVTGPTENGTNLEVNVDNKTIVINETGTLSVASDSLVQYKGENAIHISETVGDAKTIALKINDNDKVLTNDENGLLASLSLKWVHANAEGQKDEIQLLGKNDTVLSTIDVADFIKDGMLDNIVFDTSDASNPKLVFTFNTSAGKENIAINVKELVDVYVAGNGVDVNNNVISLKLDGTSEAFLSVTSEGLKLSGIQGAIETAKTEVNANIANEVATLNTSIETLDSKLVAETNARLESDAKLREDYVLADANIVKGYQDADALLETAYKAADASIIADYKNADAAIIAEFKSADEAIKSDYIASDNAIRNEFNAENNTIKGLINVVSESLNNEIKTRETADANINENMSKILPESKTYTDSKVSAETSRAELVEQDLLAKTTTNTKAIETLNGGTSVDGSVKHTVFDSGLGNIVNNISVQDASEQSLIKKFTIDGTPYFYASNNTVDMKHDGNNLNTVINDVTTTANNNASEITKLYELINTMQATITSLSNRIETLETELTTLKAKAITTINGTDEQIKVDVSGNTATVGFADDAYFIAG